MPASQPEQALAAAPFITVFAHSPPRETLLVWGGGRDPPFILNHFVRRIDSASRHRQLLKPTNFLTLSGQNVPDFKQIRSKEKQTQHANGGEEVLYNQH